LKENGFVVVICLVDILAKMAEFAATWPSKTICGVGVELLTQSLIASLVAKSVALGVGKGI
jgi:hypothetical protein